MQEQTRPDINEQYTSATHASNLRVEADSRSQADILIAAGWAHARLGSALLRLHSEWDGAAHPKFSKAAGMAVYLHDMAMLLGRLKSLPDVREQVAIQADRWNMENPLHVSASVLQWWLARQCQACNGTRFEVISGTGRQSGKVCRVCHGSGESPVPCGEDGRKLAVYIEDCLGRARTQISNRLHHGR